MVQSPNPRLLVYVKISSGEVSAPRYTRPPGILSLIFTIKISGSTLTAHTGQGHHTPALGIHIQTIDYSTIIIGCGLQMKEICLFVVLRPSNI